MKNFVIFFLLGLLYSRCTQPDGLNAPKVNYDQASIELMKELEPQLVGTWQLRQVNIKYQSYNTMQMELNIKSDTTLQDLGTLTIQPATVPRSNPRDLRRGEYEGTIRYKSKTYPIQFDLLANSEWIHKKTGPQAFFLFSYFFPVGSHLTEPEEAFLQNIGLIGDNFSMENTTGQHTMVWRGLNRGIDRIEMVRQ